MGDRGSGHVNPGPVGELCRDDRAGQVDAASGTGEQALDESADLLMIDDLGQQHLHSVADDEGAVAAQDDHLLDERIVQDAGEELAAHHATRCRDLSMCRSGRPPRREVRITEE